MLDRLIAEGSLDESRLAEVYVAERVRKGFGPLRIRRELNDKGLSDAAIEPHLAAMAGDWPQRLAEAHDRRFGPGAPADLARAGPARPLPGAARLPVRGDSPISPLERLTAPRAAHPSNPP